MKNTQTRRQGHSLASAQSLFTPSLTTHRRSDLYVMTSRRIHLFAFISLFISLLTFNATQAKAQSAAVKVTARVSGTVAISVAPTAQAGSGNVQIMPSSVDQRTVAVSLSGSTSAPTEIKIPVYIRSNVGYALSASMKMGGTTLSKLVVTSTQATGQFVVADALQNLNIAEAFDGRSAGGAQFMSAGLAALDLCSPVTLLSGSRISRAGTLTSPNNAVEVMLAVAITPPAGADHWTAELILSA